MKNHRLSEVASVIMAVAIVTSVAACASEPTMGAGEATLLIVDQFPEADIEVTAVEMVGEEAQATTRFNGTMVRFVFLAGDDGWRLEAVEQEGARFAIGDLEQISETMVKMATMGTALTRFQSDNDTYPEGESAEALELLLPGYLEAGTTLTDSWENAFGYTSDGEDYTLTSFGPDGTLGTRDDIVLHSGVFIDA